jgi:hypothetical protein
MPRDFDSPWKETLDLFLNQFLEFFFPRIHSIIDWNIPYESLDTELQQIIREAELGQTIADRLYRVKRQSGEDLFLLIYIEIQNQTDPQFPFRMFVYHYRILERYNQHPISLAVLGDESASWRPEVVGTTSESVWAYRPGAFTKFGNQRIAL